MKIRVQAIPADGLDFETAASSRDIGLEKGENFRCLTPLYLRAHLEKVSGHVLAKTEVKARFALTCAKCLGVVEQERTGSWDLDFDITPTTDFIDLGEDVRQEMIVLLSDVVLCRQDCKGICPGCGINLNEQMCRCGGNETKVKTQEES